MQPRPFSSSPPPLWAIYPTSSAATVPTTPELTLSPKVSKIMQKKASPSEKLSPLMMNSSPSSSGPQSSESASPFSFASTPVKVVPGKGLTEKIDPYHTIKCYDQLTSKVVPMHASMIGCSTSDTELNGSVHEVPIASSTSPLLSSSTSPLLSSSTSPLLSSSIVQSAVSVGTSMKPQLDKNYPKVPIQPITLTHKYQENKHSRYQKKHGDTSSPIGSRSHSNSPSSGNSTGDVSIVGIPSGANSVSTVTTEVTTPAGRSPLTTHSMLNAAVAGLPVIPQPFPFPIMLHPTFTPTTPGTQLPFVYPSLMPLGIGCPLSALQQFPMLQQNHPNNLGVVNSTKFVWPPSSKVATGNFVMPNSSMLQTPPSSAQDNRKRCTLPLVLEGNSEVTSTILEPSSKKTRPDFVSTSASCCLPKVATLNTATMSTIAAASITRHNNFASQKMDTIHKSITDGGSSSESEMKDNGDSDSEDDVVTCLQEPAPVEGTNDLPPCKSTNSIAAFNNFLW